MSHKNRDQHNRWRSITIAFRVSPEENEQINEAVSLSGLTKQSYITDKLLNREIIVQPSPRTFKALRNRMDMIIEELHEIEQRNDCDPEFLETIRYVTDIYARHVAPFHFLLFYKDLSGEIRTCLLFRAVLCRSMPEHKILIFLTCEVIDFFDAGM